MTQDQSARLEAFVAQCDAVAARLGLSRSALSYRLLHDHRRLDAIKGGKDIGVRRWERAERDLAKFAATVDEPAAA